VFVACRLPRFNKRTADEVEAVHIWTSSRLEGQQSGDLQAIQAELSAPINGFSWELSGTLTLDTAWSRL